MSEKNRKNFGPEEKIRILKEHLLEGKAVSDLCEPYGTHPTQFYRWQKERFEQGKRVFERERESANGRWQKKLAAVEAKLTRQNEGLAELMEEPMTLKKVLGRAERRVGTARYPGSGHRLCPPLVGEERTGLAGFPSVPRSRAQ